MSLKSDRLNMVSVYKQWTNNNRTITLEQTHNLQYNIFGSLKDQSL